MQVNKTYLYVGIAFVLLIVLFLLYQNAQNKKALAVAQAQAAQNLNGLNFNSSGWLGQILNSQAVAALIGGISAGASSNATKG